MCERLPPERHCLRHETTCRTKRIEMTAESTTKNQMVLSTKRSESIYVVLKRMVSCNVKGKHRENIHEMKGCQILRTFALLPMKCRLLPSHSLLCAVNKAQRVPNRSALCPKKRPPMTCDTAAKLCILGPKWRFRRNFLLGMICDHV